ncbi:hypothetical protein N8646_01160 [bacterium]|nr:hypothetical protein [bacterium]
MISTRLFGTMERLRLVSFANGQVAVSGGIPYDPVKAAAARNKIRKATDRPEAR